MTAINDTVTAVQALIQQLQQSASAANGAASQAERARAIAATLGHNQSVAGLTAIHHAIGEIHKGIGDLIARAQETISQAKAIEGG